MQKHPIDILPAEVHTAEPLSTHVKRPKLYLHIDRLFPPDSPLPRRRVWAVGLGVAAVAGALLLWRWGSLGGSASSGAEGGFRGGLPVLSQITERETDSPPTDATEGEPTEIPTDSGQPAESDEGVSPPEIDPPSEPAETLAPEPPTETSTEQDGEASLPSSSESTSEDTEEPPADLETGEQETAASTEPQPVPDGCFPIGSADVSEALRGVGYIYNEGVALPSALPVGSPWRVETPAVLIVNTHPYEGYHDGSPRYDPTQGGLAQTNSPNDPDGVVALGVALTRALRDRGVTVIHLRLPTTPEESSTELYDRTEDMIRYYCRLYPDIGLVLDLRRSAELTEKGEILRTEGSLNGDPCAQLRVTVGGGRDSEALGYDLAVALALRESLWAESPTVSRPVRVRSGSGLVSDLTELRVLTLEIGAAGNTYAEAEELVSPLAQALDAVL